MSWSGIPEFMHKHDDSQDGEGDVFYICGELFRSWSNKWMNSYSDICEYDGDFVFRFTSGRDVRHLPLCPVCWADDSYHIPPPRATAFNDVRFHGEHGYEVSSPAEVEVTPGIYLWDYIK